jgi:hypothetical protein
VGDVGDLAVSIEATDVRLVKDGPVNSWERILEPRRVRVAGCGGLLRAGPAPEVSVEVCSCGNGGTGGSGGTGGTVGDVSRGRDFDRKVPRIDLKTFEARFFSVAERFTLGGC